MTYCQIEIVEETVMLSVKHLVFMKPYTLDNNSGPLQFAKRKDVIRTHSNLKRLYKNETLKVLIQNSL